MNTVESLADVLSLLADWQARPAPFAPGEEHFWDDPHISAQMLAAHLDPETDAASRRPETIEHTVDWIVATLGLAPGMCVLDLGCGPGLYATRLARYGLRVTGVDCSRRSIGYAKRSAGEQGLEITFRHEDYLALDDGPQYDAALLIYGDLCPLQPSQRERLLRNVHRALKRDGCFVLDVSTGSSRRRSGSRSRWRVLDGGFWSPDLHLLLENCFDYPEDRLWLDQAIVVEAGGRVAIYRMWLQDFTPASITAELEQAGFDVEGLWGDLTGGLLDEDGEWIGVLARRA